MHFEQSNEWARFQQALGRSVYVVSPTKYVPFIAQKRGEGEGIAVEKRIVGTFRYLDINGWNGLVGEREADTVLSLLNAGKRLGAVWVRWTPNWEIPNPKSQIPKWNIELHVTRPMILIRHVPPSTTLVIDVTKSEEELLSGMHEKTRYNIRLAERKGVVAQEADVQEGFASFWRLMQETARRDKIGVYSEEYYRTMLETMREGGTIAHLFLAQFQNAPLATAIVMSCGDTATFLHGGSASEHRNLMAPHLLQWRMMQWAKQKGFQWYDFWGIAPQIQNPKSKIQNYGSWAGITRFKMGFGGEVKKGMGTFDIVCRPFEYKVMSLGRIVKDLFK
ncbi:MAG: peptidoglycan bridge formation glycyltransferase FemA/FemB family protein [Patescibacteria group bacterium]